MADDLEFLLDNARQRAGNYLRSLPSRPVAPTEVALAGLTAFDGALSDSGHDPLETLALLDEVGGPATVASAGGRYFGFVTGSTLPAALAASWLARSWDQNAGMTQMSPVAARLEQVSLVWLADLLGLPDSAGGSLVTGATMANVSALLAARNALLAKHGWDVDAQGMFGAPVIEVFVGAAAHSSIFKALSMVGLGRDRVQLLPVDDQGAIDSAAFPELVASQPNLVIAQSGNVNTGAQDPFGAIIDWAHGAEAWVHIDGAFGLWAAAAPARMGQVERSGEADSWATDCHKWLNVPYDCGAVFVRDAAHLSGAFAQSGAYLRSDAGYDPLQFSPESSQRARGIEVWAALHHLGRAGVADLVERCCAYATDAGAGLAAAGLVVLNNVELNQVLFRCPDPEMTASLLAAIQTGGVAWMGSTEWEGNLAVRLSVSSWVTTAADIDATVTMIAAEFERLHL